MIFYRTQNKTLQKYMEGYYFISEDKNSTRIRYKTFPNNYCIISVCKNADVLYEKKKIIIKPSQNKKITTDIVLRYSEPLEAEYENAVDEITFYFKPLGLNNFISEYDIISDHETIMDFTLFSDFNASMLTIFQIKNREKQIEALEEYWLSKLLPKDLSLIESILYEIETSDLKIDEIAQKFKYSRQYINKLFLKHIGKSPTEYRKIHRFRNAIKQEKEVKNLKELTYDNLFYDPSHFNKDFKELTKSSPSSFFKNVDTQKENVWLFV